MKKPFSKLFSGKDQPESGASVTQAHDSYDGQDESLNMNEPSTSQSGSNASPEQPDTQAPVTEDANNDNAPSDVVEEASDNLADALQTAEAERDEFKDQYLRARAEAENIRRRADQQRANDRKYAVEGFARELLDVRDSLDHAGSVELDADASAASQQMREGLELTLKQMDAAMEKFHVEAVAPETGEKFDPECHQAMSTMPAEGVPANHIVNAFRKGYRLHDRLLRPAMVVVASAVDGAAVAEESANQAESGKEEAEADSGQSNT